ncbi:MAG: phage tail tape measure protein [Deltaproteobacteria bacterium]|nr:MAG: phage tail tape measure protein [Deltaproteobacteria bacterium]
MALNQLGLGFVFTAKDLASGVIERIDHSFGRLEHTSAAAESAMRSNLAQFAHGAAIAGAGLAGLAVLDHAIDVSSEFSAAIAEVSTLIDEATFSTAELTRVSLDLSMFYGGSAKGQARALYQTISAGITDATKATDLLRVANELAIGGVTETKTAVDALTNVVNAYAATGARARDVSDAFFVAIRAGKTTASELASVIGRVAPTAAGLGVSFSDLLAAIASVTGQGLDTAEAVTGLKAALANVIKPTSDATKEASRLGIKFDAATLRARGLNGFLTAITSSAQFNADSLSKLFGSVEGLNAMMALTANHGATFNTILGQMGTRAGATKAAFDIMANTLAFQRRRFASLKESALIVIGQALEPIAKAIVGIANAVLEAFLKIPKPIRDFAVKAAAAVSVVLVLVGGFIASKAAIAILLIGLKALGITIGGIVASLLPLIAVFAVLALVVAGFVVAFRHDVGGIATFVENVAARIKLLFQGLAQLFSDGGFSGAVMAELGKAENAGVKQFAIRVYQIVYRIQRFFEGVADGFGAAIQAARPVFEAFVAALRELGEAFGVIGTASTDALASIGSDRYARAGASLGQVLARIVTVLVDGLTIVIRVAAGIINGVREAIEFFRPAFEFAGKAIAFVAEEIGGLISDLTGVNDRAREGGSVWRSLGEALGAIAGLLAASLADAIGVVALALRTVIAIVREVIQAFKSLGTFLGETAAKIYLFFTEDLPKAFKAVAGAVKSFLQPIVDFLSSVVESIHNTLDRVIAFVGRLVAKIPSRFRPAFLDSIVDAGEAAQARIAERAAKAAAPTTATLAREVTTAAAVSPARGGLAGVSLGAAAAGAALPAAAELRVRGQISDAEIDAIVSRGVQLSESRPIHTHVTVAVDGEPLARATARANRTAAARAFYPVTVE